MAAVTRTWNDASPAGTDNIQEGDDAIRNFKTALVERLRNGGHRMPDIASGATVFTDDGRHSCGESLAAGSAELAGEFNIYAADGTTVIATFRDSTAAGAIASTPELYMGTGRLRTTGDLRAATATISGAVILQSTLAVTGAVTLTDHLIHSADNTKDIGASGATRFRDLFLGRNAVVGGTLAVTGTSTFTGAVTFTAAPIFNGGVSLGASTFTGLVTFSGGIKTNPTIQTGDFTVLSTDTLVILTTTGTGPTNITLPAASTMTGQHVHLLCRSSSGTRTLVLIRNGADTINDTASNYTGLPTVTTGRRVHVHLISDGSNWWIANEYDV